MSRGISLLLVLGLVSFSCAWITAQSPGLTGTGRPLDLPSGGLGGDDDDEDAPELITYYGSNFEGDAFFWCLDKSCSMGWNGEIGTLIQETTQAIQQLSNRSEFGIVAYSGNTISFSNQPRTATPGAKASGIAWVSALTASGSTCLEHAGVVAVNISNQSSKTHKKVLVLGDGVPSCNGSDTSAACLASITAANWQSTPIDTLYISADSGGITFMQQLAALNNGTFTLVE